MTLKIDVTIFEDIILLHLYYFIYFQLKIAKAWNCQYWKNNVSILSNISSTLIYYMNKNLISSFSTKIL